MNITSLKQGLIQLLVKSNVAFSVLLKGSLRHAALEPGIQTSDLSITGGPALPPELQPLV